jgi:hypothetical protein
MLLRAVSYSRNLKIVLHRFRNFGFSLLKSLLCVFVLCLETAVTSGSLCRQTLCESSTDADCVMNALCVFWIVRYR